MNCYLGPDRHTLRLITFLALLLPLQAFSDVYDVSTTVELREALAAAADAGGDNIIRLAAGTYSTQDDGGGTFEFNSALNGQLSLEGQAAEEVMFDGALQEMILLVTRYGAGAFDVAIRNLTFQNSAAEFDAAVQFSGLRGELEFRDVRFIGNLSGALSISGNEDLNVVVDGCSFSSNVSETWYAAVFAQVSGGFVEIKNSSFIDNSGFALIRGNYPGRVMISNSYFKNNQFSSCARCSSPAITANSVHNSSFINNTFYYGLLGVDELFNSRFSNNGYSGEDDVRYTVNNGFSISLGTGVVNNQFIDSGIVFVSTTNPLANNLFSNTRLGATDENGLPNISNNIFINNEQADLVGEFYAINLNNNYIDIDRVEDIQISGSGNLSGSTHLGFVNAEEGDYRLTSASGFIDTGTTDSELAYITDYDYTGTIARIIGASIDIGPYEYDADIFSSPSTFFTALLQIVQTARSEGGSQQNMTARESPPEAEVARQLVRQEGATVQARATDTADKPSSIPVIPHYLMLIMTCLVGLFGLRRLRDLSA